MTDGDIQRCRKFKHFSIGSVIFYMVVVAAYIAMVNEPLIEQLMDVSISSVWLSFLLINTKLYDISPIIIIVVYGSFLLFFGYRLYVFIPAVKRARAARARGLGSSQDFQRIRPASKRRGVARSCSVLYSKVMDIFGHLMYNLSDSAKMAAARREQRNLEMWTSMNRTHAHTASVSSEVTQPLAPKQLSSIRVPGRKDLHRRRSAFRLTKVVTNPDINLPPFILAMRGTGDMFVANSENYVEEQITAAKFFNCAKDSAPSCSQDLPIVYTMSATGLGTRARNFKENKGVSSDPFVTLRRLLSRHFLGPEAVSRGEEISAFEELDALNCTFYLGELLSLLDFVFDIYYPNNSILTKDERMEVLESFHSWWRSVCLQTASDSIRDSDSKKTTEQGDCVSFADFSAWFLRVAEILTVTHTMRSGLATI